ncbi:MAG TPA: KEOPS complex subunit Cgi121 [Nitrososphaera sp.]|nr:KEOPS complex subunit Cgi121 [Nitrososphaera sp.]
MITLRLLGGAKRAVGKPLVALDRPSASINEILEFLRAVAVEPNLLLRENLIIAINGADCAIMGAEAMASDGDVVTIVPVIHGGSPASHHLSETCFGKKTEPPKISQYYLSLLGIRDNSGKRAADILEEVRSGFKGAIQAVNADSVFGCRHIMGVLGICVEAEKRGVMIANRLETEILVRFAMTAQIADAIKMAGFRSSQPAVFVLLSRKRLEVADFSARLEHSFSIDNSVILPGASKFRRIISEHSWDKYPMLNEGNLGDFLVERAAILVR